MRLLSSILRLLKIGTIDKRTNAIDRQQQWCRRRHSLRYQAC